MKKNLLIKSKAVKDATLAIKEIQPGHESRLVLYSRLPSTRDQNPERFDNLLSFWSTAIHRVASTSNLLLFTPQQLKEIFTIDGVAPISLLPIIDELERRNEIELLQRFTTQMGWSGWLWTKLAVPTFQWIFGGGQSSSTQSSSPTKKGDNKVLERKLLFIDLVTDKAEELYQHHLATISSSIDQVVSITKVEKLATDWTLTKDELNLLLFVLDRQGKAKIITLNNETKMQEKRLAKEMDVCKEEITKCIRSKQKSQALVQIRKRKTLESILEKKSESAHNIHKILLSIDSAHSNQQVVETIRMGVTTLKKVNDKMTVDQVDNVMDSLSDALLDQKEIEDAMSDGFKTVTPVTSVEEDEELEKQFKALEEEMEKDAELIEIMNNMNIANKPITSTTTTTTTTTATATTNTTTTSPIKQQQEELDKELEKELEEMEKKSNPKVRELMAEQ
eukprot:gene10930-12737_t